MFSSASLICYSPSENRRPARARRLSYSSGSKKNEPTFYAGDNLMALFVNPCEYPTYVDLTPRKGASRKKRFCETDLALGRIGELGKVPAAPFILPSPFILPPSSFSSSACPRVRKVALPSCEGPESGTKGGGGVEPRWDERFCLGQSPGRGNHPGGRCHGVLIGPSRRCTAPTRFSASDLSRVITYVIIYLD